MNCEHCAELEAANSKLRSESYFLISEVERWGGTYDATRKVWLHAAIGAAEAARIDALSDEQKGAFDDHA